MIEKAATEKAVRDIDDRLAPAVAARQKAKAVGQQFFDATRVAGRFPAALPDRLRPAPGAAAQQRLYEDFARLPRGVPPAMAAPAVPGLPGPLRQVSSPAMMAGHPSQVSHSRHRPQYLLPVVGFCAERCFVDASGSARFGYHMSFAVRHRMDCRHPPRTMPLPPRHFCRRSTLPGSVALMRSSSRALR